MKKIFMIKALACVALLGGASLFAKEFDVAFNMGPSYRSIVSDAGDLRYTEGNYGITLLKITDKDFVRKYSLEGNDPGNIFGEFFKENSNFSYGLNFTVGLGKALVHNEKATLALTGVVGVSWIQDQIHGSDEIQFTYGSYKEEFHINSTYNLVAFRSGFDLTGVYRFAKKLALFANLGLYCDMGNLVYEAEPSRWSSAWPLDKDSYTTSSDWFATTWTISPSLGVCLSFGN